jgi:hypothetical protein
MMLIFSLLARTCSNMKKLTGLKAIAILGGFSAIIAGKTPPFKVADTEWVAEKPSSESVQTMKILEYGPTKGWMSVFGPKNGPDGIHSMSASNGDSKNEIILSNHLTHAQTYRANDFSSTTPWLQKSIAPGKQHVITVKGSRVCVQILGH